MREPDKETEAEEDRDPGAVALSIAGTMQTFGSGEMATLRRLESDTAAPAFWRLAAGNPILEKQRDVWIPIVRALALLTPKGPPGDRGDLHESGRRLGSALCDGGHRDWPGSAGARPLVSEQRLAQLLSARGEQRRTLLVRAVRALAARRDPRVGIDVTDLAWTFVNPDPRRLASAYYARLDRAERRDASDTPGAPEKSNEPARA